MQAFQQPSFRASSRHVQRRSNYNVNATVLSTSSNASIVVERRAADVIVLGDSALALAASFSLARRGKKVIHIPDLGIKSQAPKPEALKPVCLLDVTPQHVSMADESLSYLQGLELQAVTPLFLPSKSLHLAFKTTGATTDRSGLGPVTGSELLDHLQSVCKQAGLKVSSVSPADLITPYPVLKLSNNTHGLLQPDGGIIDAAGVTAALKVLGQKSGVQLRDSVVLQGWLDTGSSFKVRAVSRFQPDAVSEYEAEQLLLAPGAWPQDSLRLFNLDLPGFRLQRRTAIKCPAASQLTKLPMTTHWMDPSPSDACKAAVNSSRSSMPGSASGTSQQSHMIRIRHGCTSDAAADKPGNKRHVDAEHKQQISSWTLYPRMKAASSCKLSSRTGNDHSQLLDSCWQLHTDHIVAQAIKAAQVGDVSAAQQHSTSDASGKSSLEHEWIHASGLVKGLAPPRQSSDADKDTDDGGERTGDGEEQSGKESEDKHKARETVAWDAVMPDGLPLLGWHPGFEEGRVLIACTAGGNVAAQDSCSTSAATSPRPVTAPSGVPATEGGQTGKPASTAQGNDATKAKVEADVRTWTGSCSTDGYHLSPLLAKVAADMLFGDSLSSSVDVDSLSPSRPAISGQSNAGEAGTQQARTSVPKSLRDTWGGLQLVQDGTSFFEELQQHLTEDERQALDELRVLAKHAQKQVLLKKGV